VAGAHVDCCGAVASAPFFGGGWGRFGRLGMRVIGYFRVNVRIGDLGVFSFWSA